uniref:Putative DNA binding, helix-turn-helix domain containing protein n=1 Tax=viral metagenome TaxID=1070528 RepID=A0A6M3LUK3_9ZZZZ
MITLVNTKEAAKILGLSVRHVRKLLKTGVLQGQKIGRDWLMFKPAGEYKEKGK